MIYSNFGQIGQQTPLGYNGKNGVYSFSWLFTYFGTIQIYTWNKVKGHSKSQFYALKILIIRSLATLEFGLHTFESIVYLQLELLKSSGFCFCATEDTICHT